MKKALSLLGVLAPAVLATSANANLLSNGNLDVTYSQEIVPGFFLPKPADWVNEGTRTIGGPYEDEMSSEPWAGQSPTPITNDGVIDGGTNNGDWAVFFKPFSGGGANGPATGHLYQTLPASPGISYTLTGWAGAEANALMQDAVFALDFRNGDGDVISSSSLSLLPNLFVANGAPFNYKQYSVSGVAPVGTAFVSARASMIGATSNPAGGGQAFVVDDFVLVPEPSSLALLGLTGVLLRRRAH